MGIPGLWDLIADCKEIVSLDEYATEHFKQHKRPLRIAVDETTWRYKLYLNNKGKNGNSSKEKLCKQYSNININERNIISLVLRLLKLNIQLVFVADGPNKPGEKYGGKGAGVWRFKSVVLQDCLRLLGVRWHDAPGEAEAECAVLWRRGTVDCIWTEDGDALMFGCGAVMRFCYRDEEDGDDVDGEEGQGNKGKGGGAWAAKRNGMKNLDKVVLYRASVIQTKHPGFDREGLVLFALLRGGDYDKGLHYCGVGKASKAVEMGFGKELCEVVERSGDLSAWRNKLRKHFIRSDTGVGVPVNFPNKRLLGLYNSPCISSVGDLEKLEENIWRGKIDERELQPFLLEKFNWDIDKYIDVIVPIILAQSLASFEWNGKLNIDDYNLAYMEFGLRCNVYYSLYAVTSLDKQWVDKCISDLNTKRSEKNWKHYLLPWGNEPKVEGKDLLTCIIEHVMEPETSILPEPEPSSSKRPSLSPQRTILEDRTRVKKSRISTSPSSPPIPTPTPYDRFAVTKEEISFDSSMFEELDDDVNEPIDALPKPLEESHTSSPSIILDKEETQQGHDVSAEMALESVRSLESRFPNSTSQSLRVLPLKLPSELESDTISQVSSTLHSTDLGTINEEYMDTFHIAIDEPLDSDSETEYLDAPIPASEVSKYLSSPTHVPSNPYSNSHLASNLAPTNPTTTTLTIRSLPTHKHTSEFVSEFENDPFDIAMDEPLSASPSISSLDVRFSTSSISRPLEHKDEYLLSHSHVGPQHDLDKHDSISETPPRSQDPRNTKDFQAIDTKELEEDVTLDFNFDIDFDIAMDSILDLDSDSDIDLDLTQQQQQQQVPTHQKFPISQSPEWKIGAWGDIPISNNHTSSSNPPDSSPAAPNPNPDPDPNSNPNPNPNILLYPSHPTGPYQELDISTFFLSQSIALSQSQSQYISSQPYPPPPPPPNPISAQEPLVERKDYQIDDMDMDMDMDLDFSGFFSSDSEISDFIDD